jgi:steroid 5-alpha reductase family enzyme
MSEKDFVMVWLLACVVAGQPDIHEEMEKAAEAYKQIMEKYNETNR